MRDVIKAGRPALLLLTALKYGWRRDGDPFMRIDGTGPCVRWVSPWGVLIALDTTVLAEPLRQKVICGQRAIMSGTCPVCAATTTRSEQGISCEHEPGCPVTMESMLQSAGASAN